jgi:hypothetical protein
MSLTHAFTICQTVGFRSDIPEEIQAKIMAHALENLKAPTDFMIYETEEVPEHFEDEGRSLSTFIPGTTKKVYAKLDDYGPPEKWDELYDKEIADGLKKGIHGRFVVTFMLAEEY